MNSTFGNEGRGAKPDVHAVPAREDAARAGLGTAIWCASSTIAAVARWWPAVDGVVRRAWCGRRRCAGTSLAGGRGVNALTPTGSPTSAAAPRSIVVWWTWRSAETDRADDRGRAKILTKTMRSISLTLTLRCCRCCWCPKAARRHHEAGDSASTIFAGDPTSPRISSGLLRHRSGRLALDRQGVRRDPQSAAARDRTGRAIGDALVVPEP